MPKSKKLHGTLNRLARFSAKPKRLVSRLSLRIVAVNSLALLVLAGGLLYVSRYQEELIKGELDSLTRQSEIYASAAIEAARMTSTIRATDGKPRLIVRDVLSKSRSKRLVARLGSTTTNRIQVYDRNGRLLGDSSLMPLIRRGRFVTQEEPHSEGNFVEEHLENLVDKALQLVPSVRSVPPYPALGKNELLPDVESAMGGVARATAWQQPNTKSQLLLSAAVPVMYMQQVLGVVHVTHDGAAIASSLQQIKRDIISLFFIALGLTCVLSLYLANSIARPLKRLARAADAVRQGLASRVEIPDLTKRRDEIGDLSGSLRTMTAALSERIDTISRFAADVAHELKNPLTSLRSAVETLPLVKTDTDRTRLNDIILQDVKRLDRLISDISNASRLDADLAREPLHPVDLKALLQSVAATYAPLDARLRGIADEAVVLNLPEDRMFIYGLEDRLGQVFRNLFDNARSFSPAGAPVRVSAAKRSNPAQWYVWVDDDGLGIPEAKLKAVFDRFYSERPEGEAFGKHSGLGLSIAKQIMDAHKGHIYAENRKDSAGRILGARFTVVLNAL